LQNVQAFSFTVERCCDTFHSLISNHKKIQSNPSKQGIPCLAWKVLGVN